MQSDDTVNKPWFNSKISGSIIFHLKDFKMLVMHISALVQECIRPGFTNGLHSNVGCGESCAHIKMRTVIHFVWLDSNKI
jgi:hypothetical protein